MLCCAVLWLLCAVVLWLYCGCCGALCFSYAVCYVLVLVLDVLVLEDYVLVR